MVFERNIHNKYTIFSKVSPFCFFLVDSFLHRTQETNMTNNHQNDYSLPKTEILLFKVYVPGSFTREFLHQLGLGDQ